MKCLILKLFFILCLSPSVFAKDYELVIAGDSKYGFECSEELQRSECAQGFESFNSVISTQMYQNNLFKLIDVYGNSRDQLKVIFVPENSSKKGIIMGRKYYIAATASPQTIEAMWIKGSKILINTKLEAKELSRQLGVPVDCANHLKIEECGSALRLLKTLSPEDTYNFTSGVIIDEGFKVTKRHDGYAIFIPKKNASAEEIKSHLKSGVESITKHYANNFKDIPARIEHYIGASTVKSSKGKNMSCSFWAAFDPDQGNIIDFMIISNAESTGVASTLFSFIPKGKDKETETLNTDIFNNFNAEKDVLDSRMPEHSVSKSSVKMEVAGQQMGSKMKLDLKLDSEAKVKSMKLSLKLYMAMGISMGCDNLKSKNFTESSAPKKSADDLMSDYLNEVNK